MNRTRWRLLVACLAVIGAAIAVAGGSAGNRTPCGHSGRSPRVGQRHVERDRLRFTFENNTSRTVDAVQVRQSCRRHRSGEASRARPQAPGSAVRACDHKGE